jgi:peptidoglycan hydrolase CwlO-like protein
MSPLWGLGGFYIRKTMSWNCINCESANDLNTVYCEVCGYERYFSIGEVNELLENQQATPSDIKKVEANFKRTSTANKKLRQENKELIQKMTSLQEFYDHHESNIKAFQNEIAQLKKWRLNLKIWLTIAGFLILFFLLARVSIVISF